MRAQQLQDQFLDCAARHGYRRDPPVPLLSTDPTLLFTNSSIVPYKPALLRGEPVPPCAQVQPCFRANTPPDRPCSFTMLGLLAGAEHLGRVVRDLHEFLSVHALPPGGALLAIACAEDTDLLEAWFETGADPLTSVRFASAMPGVTRWRYGEGEALTGRGAALLWRDPHAAAHPGCNPGCGCGRYQVVGTVIVATSQATSTSYVEAVMGLEGLAATHLGGDLLALPEYADLTRRLTALGYERPAARATASAAVAAARLLAAGCVPGPRGAGHVLRRLVRSIPPGLTDALAAQEQLDSGMLARLHEELTAAAESRARAVDAARRFVSSRQGLTTQAELRATFGLPGELARSILDAATLERGA